MADNRTEKATPKRRKEAREKGQIARSTDLTSAAVVMGGIVALIVTGPTMLDRYAAIVRVGLGQSGSTRLAGRAGVGDLFSWGVTSTIGIVAPIAITALAAGLIANVIQNRPAITTGAIGPQWNRLDPRSGFKRIFGVRALFEGGKTVVKTSVVAVAAFVAIWPRLQDLGELAGAPPGEIMSQLASSVMTLALYVCVAFLLIGIIDFAWQRYQLEKSLRMTKEEVRQESRQSDLAPEVRSAIRRRQFARARQRMIADVATADVVVTNPTHFAVALRYDGSRPAPEMVAKGVDLVAAAIRKAAEDADVPVLQNPPLARALYKEVEIGQMIPDSFFAAVAEVLAFVYRTAGRRRRKAS
jgi:flagellar biosynthesis protein FlhB